MRGGAEDDASGSGDRPNVSVSVSATRVHYVARIDLAPAVREAPERALARH